MSLCDEIRTTEDILKLAGLKNLVIIGNKEYLPVESVRFCFREMKVLLCCCEITKPNECASCVLIKRRLSELEGKE